VTKYKIDPTVVSVNRDALRQVLIVAIIARDTALAESNDYTFPTHYREAKAEDWRVLMAAIAKLEDTV
jgi:hypothetical protein